MKAKNLIATVGLLATPLVAHAAADTSTESSKYLCTSVYSENSQENPYFTEVFNVDLDAVDSESRLFKYGVSPGDGDYYANFIYNSGTNKSEFVASIFNNDKQTMAAVLLKKGTREFTLMSAPLEGHSLLLSCQIQ